MVGECINLFWHYPRTVYRYKIQKLRLITSRLWSSSAVIHFPPTNPCTLNSSLSCNLESRFWSLCSSPNAATDILMCLFPLITDSKPPTLKLLWNMNPAALIFTSEIESPALLSQMYVGSFSLQRIDTVLQFGTQAKKSQDNRHSSMRVKSCRVSQSWYKLKQSRATLCKV